MVAFTSRGVHKVGAHAPKVFVLDLLLKSSVTDVAPRLQETAEGVAEIGVPAGIIELFGSNEFLVEPVWDHVVRETGLLTCMSWFHLSEVLRIDRSEHALQRMLPTGSHIAFSANLSDGERSVRGKIDWQNGHSLGRVPIDKPWTWNPETIFFGWVPS